MSQTVQPRQVLRVGRRMIAFGVAMLVASAVLTSVVAYPIRRHRRVLAQHGAQWCAQLMLGALGVRVRVDGHASTAQGLLVANHLSWLDILAALSVWHCTFVAKREVQRWPVIGAFADALGVLWIDRTRARDLLRVIPALETALRDGASVMLFPEGTTSDGHTVLPFRSGLLEAVRGCGAAIVPLTLTAQARPTGAPLCWYGVETLAANLPRVAGLSGAQLTIAVHEPIRSQANRKHLASAAFETVSQHYRRSRRQRLQRKVGGRETDAARTGYHLPGFVPAGAKRAGDSSPAKYPAHA